MYAKNYHKDSLSTWIKSKMVKDS